MEKVTSTTAALRVRRAPRYWRFAVTGVLVAVVLAVLAAVLLPGDSRVSESTALVYLLAFGVPVGGLAGAVVALTVERRSGIRR